MKQVVYIDVLIVLNILVTYLLLLSSSTVLRAEPTPLRMIFGSFLGGIYSLIILAPTFSVFISILIKLLLSVSIVSAAFKPRSLKALLRCVVTFFSMNFIFAGLMFAVFIIFKPSGMQYKNGSVYFNFNFVTLLITAIICYFSVYFFNRLTKRDVGTRRIYELSISIFGKKVSGKAKLDTGNTLTDGFLGTPVVVARKGFIEPLLPESLALSYFSGDFDLLNFSAAKDWNQRVRVVPAKTVNGTALLPSFRPDYIEIGEKRIKNVIIAVCGDDKMNTDYDCLLNSELVSEFEGERKETKDENTFAQIGG